MHGFVLLAIASILKGRIAQATVFMVLAINFKQMALYFALPFGVYALALLYKRHKGSIVKIFISIIGLVAVLVITTAIIWSPFIYKGSV